MKVQEDLQLASLLCVCAPCCPKCGRAPFTSACSSAQGVVGSGLRFKAVAWVCALSLVADATSVKLQ
jgi:hypothetical protein